MEAQHPLTWDPEVGLEGSMLSIHGSEHCQSLGELCHLCKPNKDRQQDALAGPGTKLLSHLSASLFFSRQALGMEMSKAGFLDSEEQGDIWSGGQEDGMRM